MLTHVEELSLRWMYRTERPMFREAMDNGTGEKRLGTLLRNGLIEPLPGKGYVPTDKGRGYVRQLYALLGITHA